MELAAYSAESATVRVVTIKHPPSAIEGIISDNSALGQIYELPRHLAVLMMAAGWVRSESRSQVRREQNLTAEFNRRQTSDRRSAPE
jgi:hypothetical protein